MCVLTNKRYKTYQTGFALCRLDHAAGVGLWGVGVPRWVKNNSNIVMWHIKSTGMTSRTECKYSFHPKVKLVALGVRSKGQISLNVDYHVNSKIYIPIFVCVLTNKIL